MPIEVNNRLNCKINKKLIIKITKEFLKYYQIENKEVSIAFVGDNTIKNLNKQYRKKDKITDVLAFPGEGDFLGEIIINYPQIKKQSKVFSKSIKEELIFILVHGLLHLLGHKDKDREDKEKMEKLGKEFIQKISKII